MPSRRKAVNSFVFTMPVEIFIGAFKGSAKIMREWRIGDGRF
jgi:hypothetical protein